MGEEDLIHAGLLRDYDRALGTDSTGSRIDELPWGTGLSARLPVRELAAGSVACLAAAIDRFRASRNLPSSRWLLDPNRITASFSGEKMLRIEGEPVQAFSELSGFFESADGWVRTHANYPHHKRALTEALGLAPDVECERLSARLAELPGSEIEHRCARGNAIAVRVRTENEWRCAEGAEASRGPLVRRTTRLVPANTEQANTEQADLEQVAQVQRARVRAERPLDGLRVLDWTRVIAGPVATRALALLGASVLRIDAPRLPEIEWQHLENGQGKRSATVDATSARGARILTELLSQADVLVTGYRPGSIESVLPRVPARIVHATVSAWSPGPWHQRRGFDSIVQAASGIALIEHTDGRPGALPAQALDHASGYLLAAGVVDSLADIETGAPENHVAVSLERTAAWLLSAPGQRTDPPSPTLPPATITTTVHGAIRSAKPALAEYADYSSPAHAWGSDAPVFDVPDGPSPMSS